MTDIEDIAKRYWLPSTDSLTLREDIRVLLNLLAKADAAVAAEREQSNKSVSFFINAWLSLLLDYLRERPAMLEALKPELQELIVVLDTAAAIRRGHE